MAQYIYTAINALVPLLVGLAAGTFLLWFAAKCAESGVFESDLDRFRRMSPFRKLSVVAIFCLFTMWGGTKERGSQQSRTVGDDVSRALLTGGSDRSGAYGMSVPTNAFAVTGFEVDRQNSLIRFEATWEHSLFNYCYVCGVCLFASTNLSGNHWFPLAALRLPGYTNSYAFWMTSNSVDVSMRERFLDTLDGVGFYRFMIDVDCNGTPDGFGQDAAWVTQTFANASEILAVGYPQWVDAQVGEGLTNGLYKLTVSVAEDPSEVVELTIGPYAISIVEAGDYVFPLEKGRRYDVGYSSVLATNFTYSVADDVPSVGGTRSLMDAYETPGRWFVEGPRRSMPPDSNYVLFEPTLVVEPDTWHPSSFDPSQTFSARIVDAPAGMEVGFEWRSSGAAEVTLEGADTSTVTATCVFPAAFGNWAFIHLAASVGDAVLGADYYYSVPDCGYGGYEHPYGAGAVIPQPGLFIWPDPGVVFFEKGDGGEWCTSWLFCNYRTDSAGTFTLSFSDSGCHVSCYGNDHVTSGYTWSVGGACEGGKVFDMWRSEASSDSNGAEFVVEFAPSNPSSDSMCATARVVFVEWETETVETWPSDRARRTLGVGEKVNIIFNPEVPLSSMQTSSETGSIGYNENDEFIYTARTDAGWDSISFRALDGGSDFAYFEVLEPTGVSATTNGYSVVNIPGIAGNFSVSLDLVLLPTNVSFKNNVQIAEIGMMATDITGYFDSLEHSDMWSHAGGMWINVEANNYCGTDDVSPGGLGPPFSDGTLTWPIPYHWRMTRNGGNGKPFANNDQHFAMTTNGTSRVWKFGKKMERLLNSSDITVTNEAMP